MTFMGENTFYVRNPRMVAITAGSGVFFLGESGSFVQHYTTQPAIWSALMQRLANPVLGTNLIEGIPREFLELDGQPWQELLDGGCVLQSQDKEELVKFRDRIYSQNQGYHLVPGEPTCQHLIFACTGSIVSGLIAPTILSLLYSSFQRQLDVILTQTAQKFVTRDLLESYGIRTWSDAFERRDSVHVAHVQLARSADCIVVLPASANSLNRLANSACTDLLSMTIAATSAPVIVAPVMNCDMWNDRAVQRNVQQLRDDGRYIIEPTLIFSAADLATQGEAMYGGHGSLWAGPGSLMRAVSAILRTRNKDKSGFEPKGTLRAV
jgi:hypothetical protein